MYFKNFFKKTHLLILLLAIFMPWQAKAQETLTVYDGTGDNQYIPMYGYYFDAFTKSECILPASELTDMEGGTITGLTFYAKTVATTNSTWGTANQKVFIKEVTGTTLGGSFSGTEGATIVFDGLLTMPTTSTDGYTITFTEGYFYNGGNLLIGIYNDVKGKYNKVEWYGVSGLTSGVSAYGNNGSSLSSCTYNAQSFLPKTTFTYTPAAGGCSKPALETPSNITSHSATISWTGGSGAFNVEYKKASEEEWTSKVANYSGTSVELDNLEANTIYNVRVQSICDGNVLSGWATKNFETPCESVTTFPFHENFNDLTTSGEIPGCWNNNDGTTTNDTYKWCYNSSYGGGYEGKCVSFDSYSNSNGNTNFLKTPVMDLPAGKVMQLRFMYKNPAGGDFSVYISTDGGVTYTTPLATGLTGQADWDEKEILLSDYTGHQNVVVVFKGTSNCGYNQANNRLYLDNVYIEEAPTCPKQSALHITAVTSSSVTLDWTAGTNDQDHWDVFFTTDANVTPDANTTPTVANTDQKPYTHSGLNPETVYFAFVRARCSDTDQSPWTPACRFVTPQIPVTIDGDHPYDNDFETENGWLFVNGDRPNQWWYGSAANNTENGEKAIYISSDNGATNTYTNTKGVVYATKAFAFAEGVYTFTYDWRAKGNQYYDYIRVALAPASYEIVATENLPTGLSDTQLPTGWIALDGGSKLNNNDTWSTQTAHEIPVSAGEYKMVFVWRNLTYGVADNQPPAAIDNISISYMTCPRPTNLTSSDVTGRTATLSWTENGTATDWVLQYATNNTFTENLSELNVSGTPSEDLTGLTPETQYYARVKSVLGAEESSWSDVANFTTLATCPKPTLSYVPNSNTAYTGSVSWTGSTADAFEVAYRPKNDFDPSDMTLTDVTRVQLENVSEYTYTLQNLTPETKYYIYIQANCGAEDGVSLWSNRVTFTTLATCLAPSYLTDEEVTSTSVILSWTKGAEDQDAWQFRYKKSSDSEYTYILVENNPSNYYELTGLEPATSYHVNVRAWCGGDDYSKWSLANQTSDKTITMACAELMLPYTCDFEGAVETSGHFASYPVPKCWDRVEMQYGNYSPYSYYPYVYSQSSDAHGGTKSLRMYKTPNSATQTIIMPAIDDSYQMNNLQIRFWAKAGSSNNTLYVGIMEGDNFVEVAAVEGVSSTYAEFTVPLLNYTGTGRNIAIRCGSSTGNSYLYFNIDDVSVEVIPTCWVPTVLNVIETSYNSASLTWNAGKDETEWNIQYKKTSESEWGNPIHVTSLPDNENPYVLTGLKRGATYDVRVQAYCDADDQSEWCNPISFTTDCGVWPIDDENALFEGFSGDAFPPACWDWIRVDNYTGWQHSTNVNDPVDPTGTAFSYWPSGDTYLILPHMHINGNAILSFDMAFTSSGSGEESSVVLSTTGMTALDFSKTLWTATEFPTTKTNVSIDLSAYNGQDVYIAFKFAGVGTSGRMWYVDNVQIYVADNVFTTEGEWNSSANWSNGTPTIGQSVHIDAPVTIPSGTSIEVNNITIGTGSITIAEGGQLKHNNKDVVATMQKNISGYSRGGEHWYFIAHPMNTAVRVSTETDLATGIYDLYAFDESKDGEQWRNFKFVSNNLTKLEVATGYLYANGTSGTFNVTGTLNPSNVNIEKALAYTSEKVFSGWNLVGNPFACNAYLAGNEAFYRINEEGSAIAAIASIGAISPMEGVFVSADSEGSITFTTTAPSSAKPQLAIGLSHNDGTSADNAIIRFDHGNSLRKLVLDESASKLSILQDGEEFAVVNADIQGEIPVNFKAAENGTYTLTVSTPLTFTYLNLIDNKTGNNVNLLKTPSYSFDARTIDYASRFKLVFCAGNNEMINDFAFISNGELIINSAGTLQVFDVLGRNIFTQEDLPLNSRLSILTFKQGVYMLRLIQGNEVKTQKIVVK